MNPFLEQIRSLIVAQDENALIDYLTHNLEVKVDEEEMFELIDSFSFDLRNSISHCVNICGSGGSGINKPNISSIATVYIALISKIDIVKSGSRANTGLFGSSDFFESLNILNYSNKVEILKKYHWGYCDHYELSPWKKYKKLLKINVSIRKILTANVIYDYSPATMLLGISNNLYHNRLHQYKQYHTPKNLHTFFTITSRGCIDEITPGATYWDGNLVCETKPIPFHGLASKEEIIRMNSSLLDGTCDDLFWRESLFKTVGVSLFKIGYSPTVENGYNLAKEAYYQKTANSFVSSIKKDIRF